MGSEYSEWYTGGWQDEDSIIGAKMDEYADRANLLSLRMFVNVAGAGETISKATQKIRETEETIRRSDRLIASISEVYRGFGWRRP